LASDFAAPGSFGGMGVGPPVAVFAAGFAGVAEADAGGGGTFGAAPEMTRGNES
jgi:hypothetical protein